MTIDVDRVAACVGRLVHRGERRPSAVNRRLGPEYRKHFVVAAARAVQLGYVQFADDESGDMLPGAMIPPSPVRPAQSWRQQIERRLSAPEGSS